MRRLLLFHCLLFVSYCSFSQSVGIGTTTPDNSAALDIVSPNRGLLIPRMNTAGILAIVNPARGLLVYDSLINTFMVNTGSSTAANWQPVAAAAKGWSLTGNAGINAANQFIGTTDNQSLHFRINNIPAGVLHPVTGSVFWGMNAGASNTSGYSNIAIGTGALKLNKHRNNILAIGDSALFHNGEDALIENEAVFNTAVGSKSLYSNTNGSENTALGYQSLFTNSTGRHNTGVGYKALFGNTMGSLNTALGTESLSSNTLGGFNTATGHRALFANTSGDFNSAFGGIALFANTTGNSNTAAGYQSLNANQVGNANAAFGAFALSFNNGSGNTAVGTTSLFLNQSGNSNTAVGQGALQSNLTGSFNTVIGTQAMELTSDAERNTIIGFRSASTFIPGSGNTIIGANAEVWGNGATNCVAIGENAKCTGNNQVRLGNALTTSIGGVVGFSNLSDGRFKKNIHDNVPGIDFIMKLRPVTYQLDYAGINTKLNAGIISTAVTEWKEEILSGFVAQEVEKAAQETGYDFSGVEKPKNENELYSLRYAEFVVPLVKAVQEQQQQIAELKKQNDELQKRILSLEKK